mgnify:CR=1 FL=1
MDDTNPEKETDEYVAEIKESVKWLGFDWGEHLYFASDYFEQFYKFAVGLIKSGFAYVDSQNSEEIRLNRGTLTTPGKDSPFRNRDNHENLELFELMRNGRFANGELVLRAKIDMASANINMRDPVIYRIRHVEHHRQGNNWCIYPLYDFAHPLSDAIEKISHSICTLEFEDHRPAYNWVLEKTKECGFFSNQLLPKQYEFSRLSLSNVILSKRRLGELVNSRLVTGWDDPRMPTLAGAKKRGYPPKGIRNFCNIIGVTKADSKIDFSVLEDCMREHLNDNTQRRIAVIWPLKLIIENVDSIFVEKCFAPNYPKRGENKYREILFRKELVIDRDDFCLNPPKGFFRLSPGKRVRLRYAFVIECTGYELDDDGNVILVKAKIFKESKSGSAGADRFKVKGNIHWLSEKDAIPLKLLLFDRLLLEESSRESIEKENAFFNEKSLRKVDSLAEPELSNACMKDQFQFERHGYFKRLSQKEFGESLCFGRIVSLKDKWKKV